MGPPQTWMHSEAGRHVVPRSCPHIQWDNMEEVVAAAAADRPMEDDDLLAEKGRRLNVGVVWGTAGVADPAMLVLTGNIRSSEADDGDDGGDGGDGCNRTK